MKSHLKKLTAELADVPLFQRCTPRDLAAIVRHVEVLSLKAGETVVAEGETSDGFFVVLEGQLQVTRQGAVVATLGPGEHFGELALLDPAPRSASVIAATDVELGGLGRRMFRVVLRDMPELSFGLFESLARMLREAQQQQQQC